MIFAILILLPVLAGILCLVSFVQMLYLESQRLRARDLPAIEYFKQELETALGMKTDRGLLAFSLIKHSTMLLIAVLTMAAMTWGRPPSWLSILEAALAVWFLLLAACYAIPQALYRRTTARWLAPAVPLLKLLVLPARPLLAASDFFQSLSSNGEEQPGAEESPNAAESIEALISAGEEEGLIEEDDRKLIQSVVAFGDKTVRQVMTPRPNLVAVPITATLEDLRQLVINEQYSRIPVYDSSIDDIKGFVHVRDMFELDEDTRSRLTVRDVMRPIRFVPESKRVNDLLREMQQDNTHLVIVVDEYGNTAGLASMEDLVEVIVGEIRDEHEPGSDVTPDGEGAWIVSGSFDLAQLHDLLQYRPQFQAESTTVGGLVSEWLGRVPAPGESVERDGIRIEVLASNGLRVEQVRLSKTGAGVLTAPYRNE